MNKLEFYLRSFINTVGQGLNFVANRGRREVIERVSASSLTPQQKTFVKRPVNRGRKGMK